MKNRGGQVVRWCRVKLPVSGRPTICIIVGQGPPALAVDAGGGCLDIFTLIYHFSFSPLSLPLFGTETEILSQRAVKPKTTNQPTYEKICCDPSLEPSKTRF